MIRESQSPWKQLELEVPEAVADDVAALLVEGGATGVELLEADERRGVPYTLLRAALPADLEEQEIRERARDALAQLGLGEEHAASVRVLLRTDTDWAHAWREHYRPLRAGERIWVVPSWEADFSAPPGAVVLELDPGLAFGTGQHPSTLLSLELLEAHLASLDAEARGALRVLDAGCGSGILTIAAAKLGAGRTLGVDVDPEAVAIARDNAAHNGVGAQVELEHLGVWDVRGLFGCVVANMLATTLVAVCHDLVRCTAAGGRLILGGLLAAEERELLEAFGYAAEQQGRRLEVLERRTRGEWVELALRL